MNSNYQGRIDRCQEVIANAESILIGAGAGLSTSDGLEYGGERFQKHFQDYIEKYNLTDMYSSAFYPFPSREERWGYWSRHIHVNRYGYQPGSVYSNLLKLVKMKDHFVITTNADALFFKAGFYPEKIFAVQGDYGKYQCAKACHDSLYDNEESINELIQAEDNFRVPSELIPICPVCGEDQDANLRRDQYFVEDENWHRSAKRYQTFLNTTTNRPLVLLELGVGYNTPSIIKYPFEEITARNEKANLIRINKDYPESSDQNSGKTITFKKDIGQVLSDLFLPVM